MDRWIDYFVIFGGRAMASSSVAVVTSSLLLKLVKLGDWIEV